jgi:radical SAM superfamily enzyme YgiQ (UPF0313 family)
LKVAPEHTCDNVLNLMRKPSFKYFDIFKRYFDIVNQKYNLNQQLIPYFISSHPGCTVEEMAYLAIDTKEMNYMLEQIQDFTPTPMTFATDMFYTEHNPYNMKKVWVAKSREQKLTQQKFFFWYKKENRDIIIKELKKIGKPEIIRKLIR